MQLQLYVTLKHVASICGSAITGQFGEFHTLSCLRHHSSTPIDASYAPLELLFPRENQMNIRGNKIIKFFGWKMSTRAAENVFITRIWHIHS